MLGRIATSTLLLPGAGYAFGYRTGRLKTAEGAMDYSAPQIAGRDEPFRSAIRQHLQGLTRRRL